ncbi:MAG: SRPBCC family protein [Bacteroidota bacterium]
MKANIEKTFEVGHPIDRVWSYLSNPEKIVTCVPGASLTEKIDEENYKGKVSLKFGPVSAKYDGAIKMDKVDQATHNMIITGSGMDAKGKGSAGMTLDCKLDSKDANNTAVAYEMEVSVTGKLAQFGSRLIVDVSDQLADQFIDSFKSALDAEAAAAAPAESADTGSGAEVGQEAAATVSNAAPPPAPKDNSVNALALMWAVIKGFFARLFGGGKKSESNA